MRFVDSTQFKVLVLFIVTLVPFIIYIEARPDLFGADPYYFLDAVCHDAEFKAPVLAHDVISGVPCNIVVIKLIMFACCFLSVLCIAGIGQHYHKDGWRAGFLVFLIPVFFFSFVRFENDVFALPLIFLAALLFIRNKPLSRLVAIPLLITAGLFWEATGLFVVGLALSVGFIWVLALPIVVFKFSELVAAVIPDLGVSETHYGSSFVLLMFGWIGLFKLDREFAPQAAVFLLLGAINSKWIIFAVPFLVGGLVVLVEGLEWRFKRWVYLLVVVMVVSQGIFLTRGVPTPEQTMAVKDAIELSGGDVQNDWDYGHWVVFYGGDTNSRFHWSWQREWREGIVLTKHFLPACRLVNDYGDVNIYRC